ncbi:TPA: hypothetical protein SL686_000933 [Pseudomonas aeruginosa]|jgi:hypothetical protein|uniref:Uncharacterized protein n=2 Tax=Pseudomonadota TaxID=1224 RepID=A0A9X3R7N4_ALCXX|nr:MULTISPECIES: hypothetical protein [Pseudomonadota]EFU7690909.1 hypothetical protein [Escherichia coli]EKU4729984.1 hypothetical protein [Citrobacter freundii]HBI3003917.1 hypothetical protein [Citrobacter farmeri]HDE1720394.1 hypothetical protein [Klebsiella pneumoniae]EJB8509950.1 hypothetical protein [Pseudomonas aeruginosa]
MESPIIEPLLDDMAALHEASAISQETLQEFAALLTLSGPVDSRITDTRISEQRASQS